MLYVIILIVGAVASIVGPWWSVALIAALACALKAKSAGQAFKVASSAGVTLWLGYALILIYSGKENLVDKILNIFTGGSSFLSAVPGVQLYLFFITIIAGMTVGFAGMAGKQIRDLVLSK